MGRAHAYILCPEGDEGADGAMWAPTWAPPSSRDVRAPVTLGALTEGVWRLPNMEGADGGQVVQHALTWSLTRRRRMLGADEACQAPTRADGGSAVGEAPTGVMVHLRVVVSADGHRRR